MSFVDSASNIIASTEALPKDQNMNAATARDRNCNNDGSAPRSTRKRKSAPKVKTACTTCKTRRVKCDESKPHCLRCIRYWGYCDGYVDSRNRVPFCRASQAQTRKAPALIAPALYPRVGEKRIIRVQEIPRQPYVGPAFESAEEDYLFNVFLNFTSPALSGAFDAPVWGHLLPQYSANKPFIRFGVVALGAITSNFLEVLAKGLAGKLAKDQNCLSNTTTYKNTIALYDKSLRHMRIALSNPNHSIRDALFCCLLVVCFEGFHGHSYTSVMHAQNGLELFYAWLSRQPAIKSHSSPFRSPNPTELDDDLFTAMHRLDLQVLSFFDSRSIHAHTTLSTHGTQALKSMPSTFLSLFQARLFLNLISRRTCHFLASILSSTGSTSAALMLRGPSLPYPECLDVPIGVSLFAQGVNIPTGHEVERAEYTAEIEAWERAYALMSKQLSVAGSIQACGATILLIHAKMTRILLAGAFFESEMEYDSMHPEFQSIYDLSASIWHSHIVAYDVGVSYHFELGLLPPLFLLVTRCRDPNLRHQAINLLFTTFHRENCWDSFSIGYIAGWVVSMEEQEKVQANSLAEGGPRNDTQDVPSATGAGAEKLQTRLGLEYEPKTEFQDKPMLTVIQEGLITAEEEAVTRSETQGTQTQSGEKSRPGGLEHEKMLNLSKSVKANRGLRSDAAEAVPEERRVRITRFNIDLTLRTAQLEYTRGPVRGKEGLTFEDTVRW